MRCPMGRSSYLERCHRIFKHFLIANPLVDTIGFLIVYRGKLRGRPHTRSFELRTFHQRSVERLDARDRDNPVPSFADTGVSGTAIAVVSVAV